MYDLEPITPARALAVIESAPGLKQPAILDILRGPLEYYVEEVLNADGTVKIAVGDVIPRPHLDLAESLKKLHAEGQIVFTPKGTAGGWRAR